MIHPSYSELIQAINNNAEEDDNTMMLNSRYSLVLATSKRARQLIAGAEPMVRGAAGKKPLSVAIDEFYQGQVKIVADDTKRKKLQSRQWKLQRLKQKTLYRQQKQKNKNKRGGVNRTPGGIF